jgi:hypothetical protein
MQLYLMQRNIYFQQRSAKEKQADAGTSNTEEFCAISS